MKSSRFRRWSQCNFGHVPQDISPKHHGIQLLMDIERLEEVALRFLYRHAARRANLSISKLKIELRKYVEITYIPKV